MGEEDEVNTAQPSASLVERVARAIHEAYRVPGASYWILPDKWSEVSPRVREELEAQARAAIAAMRDPTGPMVDAGLEVYRAWLPDDAPRALDEAELVADVFRAMLSKESAEPARLKARYEPSA